MKREHVVTGLWYLAAITAGILIAKLARSFYTAATSSGSS